MGKRRLSEDEIDHALRKIRSLYDDFIIKYFKPLSIREDFEDRYIQALRHRRDPANFFQEELIFLNEMEEAEERKLAEEQAKQQAVEQRKVKQKHEASLADRVMAEHRRLIEKYPSVQPENSDIEYEVQKLFGALTDFEQTLWPEIEAAFGNFHGRAYNPYRYLQHKLYDLLRKSVDDLPGGMSRYMTVLDRVPRKMTDVEIEHKRCLVDVAGLLHNMRDELQELLRQREPHPEIARKLEYLRDRIDNIISDFRMKDLKPNMTRRV